jgi:hypothetical protein
MAESQAPYKYQAGEDIRFSLSEDRFAPYLKNAGYSQSYAFNLYLYNARLSKAFLFPLHILEVSLRNHISAIFTANFGSDWPHESGFQESLTAESLAALNKGITRAKSTNTNDVVATLTFDFWSNLFRSEYDRPFWQTNMSVLLPNANRLTRKEFQKNVRDLNDFRNRVAHHEPIHKVNISAQHAQIIGTISWLCNETAEWTKHYSTVNQVMRTKPSRSGETAPFFKDRCDDNFKQALDSTSLNELSSSRFVLCHDTSGQLLAVIETQHVAQYLLSLKEGNELVIDLTEHKVSQLIERHDLYNNYSICGGDESLYKASTILKKRVNYIVVIQEKETLGVIAKAHRHY